MPFEAVDIDGPAKANAKPSVKIGVRGKARNATIRIPSTVVSAIGWNDADHIGIMVGTGTDFGRLRLVLDSASKAVTLFRGTRKGAGYYQLALGPVTFAPKVPNELPPEVCEVIHADFAQGVAHHPASSILAPPDDAGRRTVHLIAWASARASERPFIARRKHREPDH